MKMLLAVLAIICVQSLVQAQLSSSGATGSFKGALPPKPSSDISTVQQAALEKELAVVTQAFQAVKKHERAADADIFIKAVRYAIEFHEWYDKKPEDGLKKARELLAEAMRRIEALKKNQTPWMNGSGHKVLGFYSDIDDSPQPYGVEIPEGLEWGAGKKPVPMWIWLHGRGDTATDIHFIAKQMKGKSCPFNPMGAIVVEPFGRYCNGWKSAGETDVLECKADANKRFNVDVDRIALAGFSMGGAGAWHLGAHYADQWACVHTGAGFVDVKRYQKLTPEKYPPWYEQKLWGVYDVPDYARNFLNVPLICYSGEVDAQRDSAEYMMEVLGKEGLHPPHIIGPGMGHKYHPEKIKEVQRLIEAAVAKGREQWPKQVAIQTRNLRYGQMNWIWILAMEKHWEDTRVDAELQSDGVVNARTTNVTRLWLEAIPGAKKLVVDGVSIGGPKDLSTGSGWAVVKKQGAWQIGYAGFPWTKPLKDARREGPIDDAFNTMFYGFLVVLPDQKPENTKVGDWVSAESQRFIHRWRSLMRGDPRVKKADEVTPKEITGCHLILWGDPQSNSLIKRVLPQLPLEWSSDQVGIGPQKFSARDHVPVMCYLNPLPPDGYGLRYDKYVVLNSGLTFREVHDKTNSLQNPKLPDWAILDITQPPNAESAGKVVAADFFDEHWEVKQK